MLNRNGNFFRSVDSLREDPAFRTKLTEEPAPLKGAAAAAWAEAHEQGASMPSRLRGLLTPAKKAELAYLKRLNKLRRGRRAVKRVVVGSVRTVGKAGMVGFRIARFLARKAGRAGKNKARAVRKEVDDLADTMGWWAPKLTPPPTPDACSAEDQKARALPASLHAAFFVCALAQLLHSGSSSCASFAPLAEAACVRGAVIGMGFADTVENEAIMRECDGNFEEAVGRLETRREARGMAAPVITREQNRERQDEMEVRHGFLADMGVALAQDGPMRNIGWAGEVRYMGEESEMIFDLGSRRGRTPDLPSTSRFGRPEEWDEEAEAAEASALAPLRGRWGQDQGAVIHS